MIDKKRENMPLLKIENLKVYFRILKGVVRAVDDVSITLDRGETLGLVGESGCGKTTTAFAIMKLLPSNGMIIGGEIYFKGKLIARSDVGLPVKVKVGIKDKKDWIREAKNIIAEEKNEVKETEKNVNKLPKPRIKAELKRIKVRNNLIKSVESSLKKMERIPEKDLEKARTRIEKRLDRIENSYFYKRQKKGWASQRERDMSTVRWKQISIIFQSAMNAFNPVYKVGDQIVEALITHEKISKEKAKKRAMELFRLVGLDPSRITGYPHEFSGGMRQRAMIAMALACNPDMIIADEPTTALDVIMQDRILGEIKKLQTKLNLSMIIITHDISVVAETANKIAIMYGGKISEHGDIKAIFERPANPYTMGLLGAFPSIKGEKRRLEAIPGSPPDLANPPPGCRFHPRCKYARDVCRTDEPPMIEVEKDHHSACHFAEDIFREVSVGGG